MYLYLRYTCNTARATFGKYSVNQCSDTFLEKSCRQTKYRSKVSRIGLGSSAIVVRVSIAYHAHPRLRLCVYDVLFSLFKIIYNIVVFCFVYFHTVSMSKIVRLRQKGPEIYLEYVEYCRALLCHRRSRKWYEH